MNKKSHAVNQYHIRLIFLPAMQVGILRSQLSPTSADFDNNKELSHPILSLPAA
jgi:hypothetical protein